MKKETTEKVLGYSVEKRGKEQCIRSILDWVDHGDRCRYLSCINPHSYVLALKDHLFSVTLYKADWLIPDGAGIVLASRILKGNIRERVTGSDIFQGVNQKLNRTGGASVFFLGSTEETLERICTLMAHDFPNIRIAGTYSPPYKPAFSDEETDNMVGAINSAAPDVLWVGMTSPKQDLWIYQNRHRLHVKFAAGIGAVFDFYTGQVTRSHPSFQRLGLEWLPRLIREPRRLWRRTFVSAPIFFWHVLRTKTER